MPLWILTTITITAHFEFEIYIITLNLTPGPSTNPGSNTYELLCLFRQKRASNKLIYAEGKQKV